MYLLSDCCGPVGPGFVLANERTGSPAHREQLPLESHLAYTFQRGADMNAPELMLYRPYVPVRKIRLFLVSVNKGDVRHNNAPYCYLHPEGFIGRRNVLGKNNDLMWDRFPENHRKNSADIDAASRGTTFAGSQQNVYGLEANRRGPFFTIRKRNCSAKRCGSRSRTP